MHFLGRGVRVAVGERVDVIELRVLTFHVFSDDICLRFVSSTPNWNKITFPRFCLHIRLSASIGLRKVSHGFPHGSAFIRTLFLSMPSKSLARCSV